MNEPKKKKLGKQKKIDKKKRVQEAGLTGGRMVGGGGEGNGTRRRRDADADQYAPTAIVPRRSESADFSP